MVVEKNKQRNKAKKNIKHNCYTPTTHQRQTIDRVYFLFAINNLRLY